MAAATELDFALASFWEFARIWKSGKKCKFTLSCDGGVGEIHLVAGLGAAEEPHFPFHGSRAQRKKTPSQLRREERRRNARQAEKALVEANAVKTREAGLQVDQKVIDLTNGAAEEATDGEEDNAAKAAEAIEHHEK